MSGLQKKKKLYHGLHKSAPQSTRQQSMQISQRWSPKFSSNSVLSICKRICFFCFVLQFIQVIYLWWKKYLNLQYSLANTEKKATNNNNNKKEKTTTSVTTTTVNWTKTSETSLLNAVHSCCLFALQFLLRKSPLK